jgi:hypothetical protein
VLCTRVAAYRPMPIEASRYRTMKVINMGPLRNSRMV